MQRPWLLRVQIYLESHPRFGNRLLGFLGAKRLEAIGRRVAIAAARRAWRVPYYRGLYAQHDFLAPERFSWEDFLRLPIVSKRDTEDVPMETLLDPRLTSPGADGLIGRSSGTRARPVYWRVGWNELELGRAMFEAILKDLGTPHGAKTAVVLMTAAEGGDQSGNMPYRTFFWLKLQKRWNMEVTATGEDSEKAHQWLCQFAQEGFTSLCIISFPGTIERLLNYEAALPEAERVPWQAFKRKHILMGGMSAGLSLRKRVRAEMGIDPASLTSESILYISSDTVVKMAQTSPFTLFLERHLAEHPELYSNLELAVEYRDRPLLQFVPPLSMYLEYDHPEGLLVTQWKHQPLIRYKIGDLLWAVPVESLLPMLDRVSPLWREDFLRAGGSKADIPTAAIVGVVLGRADEVVIVNAANVSTAMVDLALENAVLGEQIKHWKHRADHNDPNAYFLYLELHRTPEEEELLSLAQEWKGRILDALLKVPAASDLVAAHRTNPIDFHLQVRAEGTAEFAGDSRMRKRTHAVARQAAQAPELQQPAQARTMGGI